MLVKSNGIKCGKDVIATIQYNTIEGGNGTNTTAINIADNSFATIKYNIIHGGNGSNDTRGIWNKDSGATIAANTIHGGNGNYSRGIHGDSGNINARNNTIFGGTGATLSEGIICGGDGDYSLLIRNNTIDGGTGGDESIGIKIAGGAEQTIQNNIIFVSGTLGWSACIEKSSDNGKYVQAIENNDLWDNIGSTILYYDYLGIAYNDIGVVNGLDHADGNIDIDPIFKDINGIDDDETTMEDNDWHLSDSSPVAVRQGGLDGAVEAWGFETDKDDVTRTDPWSIGAYEKD